MGCCRNNAIMGAIVAVDKVELQIKSSKSTVSLAFLLLICSNSKEPCKPCIERFPKLKRDDALYDVGGV